MEMELNQKLVEFVVVDQEQFLCTFLAERYRKWEVVVPEGTGKGSWMEPRLRMEYGRVFADSEWRMEVRGNHPSIVSTVCCKALENG